MHLRRRFFRLTAINIVANLTVPIVGLVDTAMLGHLDELRFLAGVALGSILFDFLYWTFNFLRTATTGLTAQAVGGDDRPAVYEHLWRALAVAAALAATLLVLQVPVRELGFSLLSGAAGVEAAGREYFSARIWGAPAALANFALLGWFLGREESGRALWMSLTANLANIALNYLFIVRLGLAARGAGLASMLAQVAMLATGLLLLWRTARRERPPRPRASDVLERGSLVGLLRLNLDLMVRTFVLMGSFAVFLDVSAVLGTAILATNTILYRLLLLFAYVIDGAAYATESLAGIFRGAGDAVQLRRLLRLALVSGIVFAAVGLASLFSFPRMVYRLLTSHREVIDLAIQYGPWLGPVVGVGAAAYIYDGLFIGLTAGRALRNAMLLSAFAVYLPLVALAATRQSNHLLWLAMAAFTAARVVTLGWATRPLLAAHDRPRSHG